MQVSKSGEQNIEKGTCGVYVDEASAAVLLVQILHSLKLNTV